MELFSMGIGMEQPMAQSPENMTADTTKDLVIKSNDFAFDLFKKEYMEQVYKDPMMMPVLISSIAHDWVLKNHKLSEEEFKAALFKFKIYEDPEISMHMQQKQMEMMQSSGMGMNPMMMGGPGMGGGMGGMPQMGPGYGPPF